MTLQTSAPAVIAAVLRAVPKVAPLLTHETWAVFRAAGGYEGVRNTYWAIIYDAVYDYLTGDKPATSFKNAVKKGVVEAFGSAVDMGYEESGGDLPLDSDTLAWLNDQVDVEFGHVDDLFSRLKKEWDGLDPINEAFARADGYARTLDAIYAEARMRGAKEATAEFVGDDGAESCEDCKKMKGKRHKLSYIIANNLIPRPGNDAYECKGYHCEHYWVNVKTGEEYR